MSKNVCIVIKFNKKNHRKTFKTVISSNESLEICFELLVQSQRPNIDLGPTFFGFGLVSVLILC